MQTISVAGCLDYATLCERAVGTLQRRGVCRWIERDELLSEGALALSAATPDTDALAVTIARRAMIDAIRKNERRERGRVAVRCTPDGADEDISGGDQWDTAVHSKQAIRPVNTYPDLWEALKALPAREYQAITLTFWGGMSQADIAVEMSVSQQRVAQIIASAEINLRGALVNPGPHTITNMRGHEATAGGPFGLNGKGVGQL